MCTIIKSSCAATTLALNCNTPQPPSNNRLLGPRMQQMVFNNEPNTLLFLCETDCSSIHNISASSSSKHSRRESTTARHLFYTGEERADVLWYLRLEKVYIILANTETFADGSMCTADKNTMNERGTVWSRWW